MPQGLSIIRKDVLGVIQPCWHFSFLGVPDMIELNKVSAITQMGGPKTMVLQLLLDYTVTLKRVSPVTTSWIPLSEQVCLYKLTSLASGIVARSLAELDEDGWIETTKFNHSCPECRCKWFRLTDKFYDLLKGKQ